MYSLIYHNRSSTTQSRLWPILLCASYGQQQYLSQDYIDVLLDEVNKLDKELVDEIITDFASGISSPSLPLSLSPSDEQMKIYLKKG